MRSIKEKTDERERQRHGRGVRSRPSATRTTRDARQVAVPDTVSPGKVVIPIPDATPPKYVEPGVTHMVYERMRRAAMDRAMQAKALKGLKGLGGRNAMGLAFQFGWELGDRLFPVPTGDPLPDGLQGPDQLGNYTLVEGWQYYDCGGPPPSPIGYAHGAGSCIHMPGTYDKPLYPGPPWLGCGFRYLTIEELYNNCWGFQIYAPGDSTHESADANGFVDPVFRWEYPVGPDLPHFDDFKNVVDFPLGTGTTIVPGNRRWYDDGPAPLMEPGDMPHPQAWPEAAPDHPWEEPWNRPARTTPPRRVVPVRELPKVVFFQPEPGEPFPEVPPQIIDIPSDGSPPIVTTPPPPPAAARPRPPRSKRVYERKPNVHDAGRGWTILNATTEAFDFVGALHDALPEKCRAKPKGKRKVTPYDQALALWKCRHSMDQAYFERALTNVVNNQAEDMAYGSLGKAVSKATRKANITTGLATAMRKVREGGMYASEEVQRSEFRDAKEEQEVPENERFDKSKIQDFDIVGLVVPKLSYNSDHWELTFGK